MAPTVQEVLTEIAVHPNREEEVEEREPEGVIVEPTTPDVAVVPAKQPQHITRAAATMEDPNDMTGLRRLASAVIVQAIEDKATPLVLLFLLAGNQRVLVFCRRRER